MNLGRAIKLCRSQKEMSQGELAELAGLSVSYVSLLEQNKRDPALSAIEKISDALNVPSSILFFLAAEEGEIKGMDGELAEKLAYTALKLINER